MAIKSLANKQGTLLKVEKVAPSLKLNDRFLVPPFTLLDARQDYWKERFDEWWSLGISGNTDPVLCELVYRWFTPKRGRLVLDPYAGDGVRGVVASILGFNYAGVATNGEHAVTQWNQIKSRSKGVFQLEPVYAPGDCRAIRKLLPNEYDLVFTRPPYRFVETLEGYEQFVAEYRETIYEAVSMLKPNRFAVVVLGELHDAGGFYVNFVSETVAAFKGAGAHYYNEAAFVPHVPTYNASETKLQRMHENVLVFYKGDLAKIGEEFDVIAEKE